MWRACSQKNQVTRGSVYCLASDGESRWGKALVALTEHVLLSPGSPLFMYLGGLPLLNLMVGEDELMSDKDYKHVMKWLWHVHLRPSGVSVGGIQITPSVLWSHLEANKYPLNRINNLMNVTDKQDVMMMFNLMQLIWSLPPPLATDNPIHYETHIALNQYSKLLHYLILPYINVNMNLHEQLKSLSAVVHLAYILFTNHNACSAFLPSPLYHDIQIMVKKMHSFVWQKQSVTTLVASSSWSCWAQIDWNGFLASLDLKVGVRSMSAHTVYLDEHRGQSSATQSFHNIQSGTGALVDFSSRV